MSVCIKSVCVCVCLCIAGMATEVVVTNHCRLACAPSCDRPACNHDLHLPGELVTCLNTSWRKWRKKYSHSVEFPCCDLVCETQHKCAQNSMKTVHAHAYPAASMALSLRCANISFPISYTCIHHQCQMLFGIFAQFTCKNTLTAGSYWWMSVKCSLTIYLPLFPPLIDRSVFLTEPMADGKGRSPHGRQETSLENSQWMGGAVRPRKSEGVKTSSNKTMHTLIQYTCTRTVYGYIIMRLHVYTTSNYNNC